MRVAVAATSAAGRVSKSGDHTVEHQDQKYEFPSKRMQNIVRIRCETLNLTWVQTTFMMSRLTTATPRLLLGDHDGLTALQITLQQ